MTEKIKVTVWNEGRHEKTNEAVGKIYPDGMHNTIAGFLNKNADIKARTATLDDPGQGLPQSVVDDTDVIIWWGHKAHAEVGDEIVQRVQKRVLEGMGLIVLHSGHYSKIFKTILGTTGSLKWRVVDEKERLWNIEPSHPICRGIGDYFELPHEEMYGERFDIPRPDEVIFMSWFAGGEVFRSGVTFQRGHGKIFYFRPGHETYPTFHNDNVQKIITNAVRWARPVIFRENKCSNPAPLEDLSNK